MNTLKEYHREQTKLELLQKKNDELLLRNKELSDKCERLRNEKNTLTESRDSLEARHKSKVKAVVELLIDGALNISDQEVADRLFVDASCIKIMKATIKRERK
jgi:predicted nuclease with TOPRIM domain